MQENRVNGELCLDISFNRGDDMLCAGMTAKGKGKRAKAAPPDQEEVSRADRASGVALQP